MKQVMISGVTSNVGKTTVTLGIMQALINKGWVVQPYKVGPDYIDSNLHRRVCARQTLNLDEFLIPDAGHIQGLYGRGLRGSDIGVVEGVMGLYDGLGTDALHCSSAGMALILDIPIVLVIDGQETSTSAAAMVKGFMEFVPQLNIIGVIVNRINSPRHFALIKAAIEKYNDITVLGYVEKHHQFRLPSRQLGLYLEGAHEDFLRQIQSLAESMERTLDLDVFLDLIDSEYTNASYRLLLETYDDLGDFSDLSMAVARDEAFNFYYQDNLNLLRDLGVTVVECSPLHDAALPPADGYYFGGGYPELFGHALWINESFRESVVAAHQEGIPILAEGGGMEYLGRTIQVKDRIYPMVGILPGRTVIEDRRQPFGYYTMVLQEDCLLGKAGEEIHGHQFHYGKFQTVLPARGRVYKAQASGDDRSWPEGYQVGQTFASFHHVHFYQQPSLVLSILSAMRQGQKTRRH